jgi:tetratricopeptide (TPR) repeat protein
MTDEHNREPEDDPLVDAALLELESTLEQESTAAQSLLTAETRAELIASLRPSREAPIIEQVIATGDRCLELGQLDLALVAYIAAEAKDKLSALADCCLQQGRLDLAIAAYAAAHAKGKLLDLADRCLDEARVDLAERAYRAAGLSVSKD